jgi:RHS repeat-associated protein
MPPIGRLFSYGKLGELTENIRTFALPFESQTYTFKMEYEYDPFNRIQSILYPDSELVDYSYNLGGMLSKVTGSVTRKVTDLVGPMQMHGGSLLPGGDELMGGGAVSGDISGNDPFFIPTETIRYSYIDSIVYNEFELKDSVVYGNGTRVRYAYDSLYRLVRLRSYTAEDELMQDIAYHYDSVGNILDIENMAATLNNGLGGAYRQEYTYDNLYRLDNATGWWEYRPLHLTLHDTVNMRYSKNGRIIRKQEYAETFKNSLLNLVRYDRQYQYSSPYSNKLGSVTDALSGANHQFGWDGCGNMVRHDNPEQGCDRRLSWTEDNRLQFVKDNGSTGAYYQYDAGGDRTYKLLYHKTTGSLNGVQTDYYTLDDATLYVSPYLVVTPQGYTKHYYAESERITTQLGKYRFAVVDSCVAGSSLAAAKLQAAATMFSTDSFPTPTPMLGYLHSLTNHPNTVSTLYFYHSDHLGSASWITNIDGRTIQHLYYLPWGEDFVNQRTGSFSSMYTFSAKEKDSETGYSYFGSRYYSSDLGIWLSVDPMADKYPSLSPYVYCADNPVRLVDPNGEEMVDNPYLLFNGTTGTLEIWDDNNSPDDYSDDTFIGSYEAHNNVTTSSQGKWEDGIYEMLDQQKSKDHGDNTDDNGVLLDSPNGSYGTAGCYRAKTFTEKTTTNIRRGMAVHAGREHKPFQDRKTEGCIRTTPEAMEAIANAISKYGSLKRIIIQNNRTSPNSKDVNKISPLPPQPEPIFTPSMPIFMPDKTRVSINYPL